MRFRPFLASLAFAFVSLAGRAALADEPPPGTWVIGGGDATEEPAALPPLPPPSPSAEARFAHVRAAILEGRLKTARAELDALAVSEDADVRAAAVELRAVVEAWIAAGGRHAHATVVAPGEPPSPWKQSFDAARLALVAGDHAHAAQRLTVLARTAPDPISAAKARALADLATALAGEEVVVDEDRRVVRASPPPVAMETVTVTKHRWYGWQTLIADGGSILTAPLVMGIVAYPIAAPIIHAAHGNWGKAGLDVGLRVGLPLGGCAVGAALAPPRQGDFDYQDVAFCALGGLGGIVAASAIDAAVLAHEDVPVKKERPVVAWSPTVAPRKEGGVSVGVGGSF